MNILENLILKFQDYLRPSYQGFGGQFSGEDLRMSVYVKTDKRLYFQDNLGVEHCLSDVGHPHTNFSTVGHTHNGLKYPEEANFQVYVDEFLNVGIGTETPGDQLDVNGLSIFRDSMVVQGSVEADFFRGPFENWVLGNDANNNVALGDALGAYITGPTGAFSITGIAGGVSGRFLIVQNTVGQNMTLVHNSSSSSAVNRIYCPNNADQVSTTQGWALLTYSPVAGGVGGWQVQSFAP